MPGLSSFFRRNVTNPRRDALPLRLEELEDRCLLSANFTWTLNPTPPPQITTLSAQTNAEGDPVSLQVVATDPNNYALQYAAVNLPLGLTINTSTGLISGVVDFQAAEYESGVYNATVIVADSQGGSASDAFTWTINDTPRPPVLSPIGSQTSNAGDAVSLQVSASQPDGDPLIYDYSGLPPGLTIDSDSGLISGTIDTSAASSAPYVVTVTATDYQRATPQVASQTFTWTVGAATPAPSLTNPGAQANYIGDAVDVPLTAADAGGYPLTFAASGLPAGLTIDTASGEITGTVANAAASTTPYSVTVTASDGQASAQQTFNWTVGGVSLTNPGDQSSLDGYAVSLALAATDADNNALTYSATGLPPGLSISTSTGVISGILSNTASAGGPYAVTVSAAAGTYTDSQSFNWNVARLSLDAPADQDNREGATVSFLLSATDRINAPTFSASGLPSGLSINSASGLISGTVSASAHGQSPYQVTVTATDGSASVSQSFVWTVTPSIALANPGIQNSAAGDAVSLAVTAQDLANNTLTYNAAGLPSGLSINSSTGVITGTIAAGASSASPYQVTVTAADGTYTSSQSFGWNVSAIYIPAPLDQSNLDADAVSLSAAAHYHGSGTLTYSATDLPDGLSINSTSGLISGTLTSTADADGPYAVTVTATDGTASASQSFDWDVAQRATLDAVADMTNLPGDAVTVQLSASDAATGSITWTYGATRLLSGLSLNTSTGLISGTITAAPSSTPYAVTVTASDGTVTASQTFNWTVLPVTMLPPGDQASVGGAAVNLAVPYSLAAGYTATFSAAGLPAGLSLNSTTGVVTGSLSAGDTDKSYLVTVTGSAAGMSSSQTFTWRVGSVVVTAPADQTNNEGNTVSLAVSAADISGTLTYSASGLPAGLTINSSSGVISGTIAPGAAGSYVATVAATNGAVADSRTFNWTVNPLVNMTSLADQANVEGDAVSLQVSASESGATLTYTAVGLPDGLSINAATGLISGTVAAGAAHDGPFAPTVTASDGTYSTSQTFQWAITHASNTAPTLGNPGNQDDAAGDAVWLTLSASDADGDSLTYSASGLPDGLYLDPFLSTIDGTIAADAVSPTPYSVTVTADDGNGGVTSQTFTWTVADAPLSAQGVPITETAGLRFDQEIVATFTDTDPLRQASDYSAAINWGDGTTNSGEIDGASGAFTVAGGHVYGRAGVFAVTVTVIDPAGGIVTAAGSAIIAAAPLSASGGEVDPALAGTPVTETLASFTDNNPLFAASSYTASINWGDGVTSPGSVSGADGFFTVIGTHAYANDGSFAPTVTITNPDNVTATASTTTNVGEAYAGEGENLTVATFTFGNPSIPASSYTATINWGDGVTTPGTVSGSNGNFSVSGGHTYAADGTFVVLMSITDPSNNTQTASKPVVVKRAPVTSYSTFIEVGTDEFANNVLTGVFDDANPNDVAGQYTATIDWGDGTQTSGTVSGSSGLFQVHGSHVYASPGVYQTVTDLLWAANTALATNTVSLLEAEDAKKAPSGPTVVPGNSQYDIWVPITQTPAKKIDPNWKFTASTGATVDWAWHFYRSGTGDFTTGDYTGFDVRVQFVNKPAVVTITLEKYLKDKPEATIKFEVTVVEVKVENPPTAFDPPQPLYNEDPEVREEVIDKAKQTVLSKGVNSLNENALQHGLEWKAKVTLVGTGPKGTDGVSHIRVGFHQVVKIVKQRAIYTTKTLVSSMEGETYLDGVSKFKPWYGQRATKASEVKAGQVVKKLPPDYIEGTPGPTIIGKGDSPHIGFPVAFKSGGNIEAVQKDEFVYEFTLSVAAQTTDTSINDSESFLFAEAAANWSFNASGSLDVTKQTVPWTAAAAAKITPPKKSVWDLDISTPIALLVKGPLANEEDANNLTWTSQKK
jgi:hypothetical protein